MNKLLMEQLQKLKKLHFKVDGISAKEIPESFTEILFSKKSDNNSKEKEIKVIYENYIVQPFDGFNLHDKWNNGVAPYSKIMYGKIIDETKGMYKLKVHSETSDKEYIGWCPKKSCRIQEI